MGHGYVLLVWCIVFYIRQLLTQLNCQAPMMQKDPYHHRKASHSSIVIS